MYEEWEEHHDRFRRRHLGFSRYADCFMDGILVSVRLGEDPKVCLLIVIGVREDGEKELWRSRTATARAPRAGPACSATSSAAG